MNSSRSEYVVKNVSITLAMQIIRNILAFISRTVFVYILGAEYLGVNSLFSDILTVLSFAELGIGNAMVFSLYRPLAENDHEKIKSLMKLYAMAYKVIGICITILGLCITPFVKNIVGDVAYVREDITLLYILFLLNSVLSYFFVYKKSLIIADQKNYVVEIYQEIFYAVQVFLQSLFLVITKEFIAYLAIMIICTLANNVYVSWKADKMYPYLKQKDISQLDTNEISKIVKNVKALVIYKVGGIILESTDSIFISYLINVITVGFYANYKMVINVFKTIGNQIMNSVVASIGNLNTSDDAGKKEKVFYEMLYICIWFFGFTTVGLCCFLTPLIRVWLGNEFVISVDAVVAACVYYYISNMHYPCYAYRTTAGLFVLGKYVPIFAAILNILLDIFMGFKWGLAGILWASTISRVLTYELVDPIIIFNNIFFKPVRRYYITYLGLTLLVVVNAFISLKLSSIIPFDGIFALVLKVFVFSISFNFLFLVETFKTKQFRSIFERIRILLRRRFNR